MEAYLGVTYEWNMQTFVVSVKPVESGHNAENIVQWNIDILHKFSIKESKKYKSIKLKQQLMSL